MRGMCERGMPPPSSLILITTSSLFSPSAMITCHQTNSEGTVSDCMYGEMHGEIV